MKIFFVDKYYKESYNFIDKSRKRTKAEINND